ncbi:Ig-like domain-containing protein [Bifidobacterium gallicum]|uniref:Large protein with C-fibronectin type III domain protein n=1 Tax=Bifidobacterium gallicum DSM 20093 = LMG 11596 TaxID=561180 RepID=A0A087AG11_9BIFI|nr:tandem-95 repeat protein [Bifidobacterium gallicum]KFI57711.1 large protein with C- fibronectin type III domain protein [Bifidobacterium gallicum DSM 20093 = LMG 11596]
MALFNKPQGPQSAQSYERTQRRSARLQALISNCKRPWLLPVVALLAMVAMIVGAIIISSVTQRHLQLDDGTVWVTSTANGKAARYNARLKEADASVRAGSPQFDVAQYNGTTMLAEDAQTSAIEASTIAMSDSTATKTGMHTLIGGDTVAFVDTTRGNMWVADAADVTTAKPADADPDLKLGANGMAVVTHDGTVYGYRPADGAVLKVEQRNTDKPVTIDSPTGGKAMEVDSFTVVNDVPFVTHDDQVFWPGHSAQFEGVKSMTLQAPPADDQQSDWVAVSYAGGTGTIDVKKGTPVSLPSGGNGEAAQPVSVNGCAYAAFSQQSRNFLRVCAANDAQPAYQTLQEITATSKLRFRVNHRLVVLNDTTNGYLWNPDDSTDVIKLQWQKMQTEETRTEQSNDQTTTNTNDFAKECSATSGKIKAEDDSFGVRPGSHEVLDVLRNDQQTDCSVLRITEVSAPKDSSVKPSIAYDGRFIQLDATAASSGKASFTYTISDGHEQTSQATVHLDVTRAGNRAPQSHEKPEEIMVEQNASYTMNALGTFKDPDGDPLTLLSATVDNSDKATVSTRADGQLTFNSGGMEQGNATVNVTVTDGTDTATQSIYFSVRPAHTLPAHIDPVLKRTTPNTPTRVDLRPYVHGTSADPAQLTSVDKVDKVSTSMLASEMAFTFTAQTPGTYYVPYTITQGTIPATGLVRVEVEPMTEDQAKPIAVNDTALLGADNTAIVEPLTNDIDPLGGVLSVTSVKAPTADGTNVKVGMVANKRVYITAITAPTKPVSIRYEVANGAGRSTGTIVLQPANFERSSSMPKASNVKVSVRTGGIVSVDVPDHVSYSDGTSISVDNELKYDEATFKGLAFVSADVVRYLAPTEPGTYPVTYTVRDNLGYTASATITFDVHRADAENKNAPSPIATEAQVAAGQKIRVPVTLRGIDPDGDDVQLTGLGNKAPTKGRVTEVGSDYLVYEAYDDSFGTDEFTYAVEDWTGRRAQATARVGIFSDGANSNVYARNDEITLRPHTSTTVPVLINDVSSDDSELTLSKDVEVTNLDDVTVHDNQISFTTKGKAGIGYITYTISNDAGITDTATLSVTVDPDAKIQAPTAYDYRVPAIATIDKRSVDVDVSPWIANPSGSLDELKVAVDPSATDHASLVSGSTTTINVELTDEARAVPYTVTNTTHGITSTAFIQVPAYGVFPPLLRKAPPISVNAGEPVTLKVADYVRVGAGKTPVIEKGSVSATKGSGQLKDDQTMVFTADKDYGGPASITFTVTDGKSEGTNAGSVKHVNSSVITLPITVIGHEIPAPTFSTTTVDVEAGEQPTTVDLTALTHSTAAEEDRKFTYAGGQGGNGIESSLTSDGKLTVSAPAGTKPGAQTSITFTIEYGKGTPITAGVTARVVASKKPLAQVPNQTVELNAGETKKVNVLEQAQNPFSDKPLKIMSATAAEGSKLSVAVEGDSIAVTAAKDLNRTQSSVVVTVADATNDQNRYVTATITFAVIGKPMAPILAAAKAADGSVTLNWSMPQNGEGGSPITKYEVVWANGSQDCGTAMQCNITGLANGTEYTFRVTAANKVGVSEPSNELKATPDRASDKPEITSAVVTGGNTVKVTWNKPKYTDKQFSGYTVYIGASANEKLAESSASVGATSCDLSVDPDAINKATTYQAYVVAESKNADFGPVTSEGHKLSGDFYGTPEEPSINASFNPQDEIITVTVNTGNDHNAGCKAIEVTDAKEGPQSCGNQTFTIDVREQINESPTYTVTGSVTYAHSATKPISKEVPTPLSASAVGNPKFDGLTPNEDKTEGTCVYTWTNPGKSTGITVSDNATLDPSGTRATAKIGRWQPCPTIRVTNHYKQHSKNTTEIVAHSDAVLKVEPEVNANDSSVEWTDRNTIRLHIQDNAFDRKGYDGASTASIMFFKKADNSPLKTIDSPYDGQTLTVHEDWNWPDDVQWKLTLQTDPSLRTAQSGPYDTTNSRPAAPTPDPEPSDSSSSTDPPQRRRVRGIHRAHRAHRACSRRLCSANYGSNKDSCP